MLANLLYLVFLLVLSPWLLIRSIRTGRYRQHLGAKLLGPGSPVVNSTQPVIWFHGVSVGEVHLLRQVIRAFRERHPDWQVVVSTTTDTGLAEARKHFPDLILIPYPFDFSWAVRRAIRVVGPRLIVLAESELWPNFLKAANRARVPVVLINGRMSPRTFRRYARVAGIARRLLFGRVAVFGMQSERYATHLRDLGVPADRVRVTGNVKYDNVLGEKDNPKTRDFRRLLGINEGELVWVAGSTHDPEERIVLNVFARLRSSHPGLKLVLVPRAPERFDEVAKLIEAAGLPYLRRSALTDRTAPVVLIDTMGELGAAWGLATIGFTGGSLNDRRGGQSMIEPAGFGVPVLFGPHTWNFRDAVDGLLEAGGAIRVHDEIELEEGVARLLTDPGVRERMGAVARQFVRLQQGATARTLDIMDEVIGRSPGALAKAPI
ncbi:MAG TPA: 3-deoxy-D-manno-octulosonic acid transferase [Gemmataceae bacterium]|nr:3-deoxy-D-manno-octulosonic acid transferase [Gemmataceae bacterium]